MIGFRVDANECVATGHLMRCIAIAEACIKNGQECLFLLAEEKETERLKGKNISYRVLNTEWNNMESEINILPQIVREEKIDWLVVDSYYATHSYLSFLEQFVRVLLVDDADVDEEDVYEVSALLHYSQLPDCRSYQQKYANVNTIILAGLQYTPLRAEFETPLVGRREKSILITTGGTDPYNMTGQIMEKCISQEKLKDYQYHVIVGSMNQHVDKLEMLAEQDSRIVLHYDVKNMSEYMCRCEMAVSAGGTTLLELCACKIPTVSFSFADNQESFSRELGKRDIMYYEGDARKNKMIVSDICQRLEMLSENCELRNEFAERMAALVDGYGCQRIARVLGGSKKS